MTASQTVTVTVTYNGRFDRWRIDVPRQGQRKPDRFHFPKGKPVEVPAEVAAKLRGRQDFVVGDPSKPDTSTSTTGRSTSGTKKEDS